VIGKTELERLYREYLPFVLAFCLKRLGNQSEAEDAAQEVFHKVASVREWTMPTRPKAYLQDRHDQLGSINCRSLLSLESV
jgi:DNA-directed RNA polymerase specialized sigma24 family protein